MSLSTETVDVCIAFLTLILLGIHAADMREQMYVGVSSYEFSDSPQKNYTKIASLTDCAFACLQFNCSSFTYNKVKECRIHSRKCSSVGAAPVPASIYYEVAVGTGTYKPWTSNGSDPEIFTIILPHLYFSAKTRCEDFNQTIGNVSGVYRVYPSQGPSREYYCYYADDNRHWNVIQYRYDGSLGFDRTWNEYKNGFGCLTQEFWLGNDEIHRVTVEKDTMLRIEMEDYSNIKKYAQYNTFYIDDEQGKYKLTIGGYTGTAGDAFIALHNGMYFSRRDRDNDNHLSNSCAQMFFGGYWYNFCLMNDLNGKHVSAGIAVMCWQKYHGTSDYTPVKVSRMMVRKK